MLKTFDELLMEAINKGKEVGKFKYKVGAKELNFTINHISNEYRLNIDGTEHFVKKLDSADVEKAKADLVMLISKVGEKTFLQKIEQNMREVEAKKNDTDWTVYSQYNSNRGNEAFTIYSRVSNGKTIWKESGKRYVGVTMSDTEDKVKEKIKDINKHYKLVHVSGYDHKK